MVLQSQRSEPLEDVSIKFLQGVLAPVGYRQAVVIGIVADAAFLLDVN